VLLPGVARLAAELDVPRLARHVRPVDVPAALSGDSHELLGDRDVDRAVPALLAVRALPRQSQSRREYVRVTGLPSNFGYSNAASY
jgi:hypothetical protein